MAMPLGNRLTVAGFVLAIALGLPAARGDQTLPPDPPGSSAAAVPELLPSPAASPGSPEVCPECGQPYNQPAAEGCGGSRPFLPLVENIWLHPPWERAGSPAEPIWRESWIFRPLSIGFFLGAADGLIVIDPTRTSTSPGVIGGIRAGWDLNHYWGTETRFAWSTGRFTDQLLGGQIDCNTNTFYFDVDLLYYPWGDTRWRPYFLVGFGTSQVRYYEEPSQSFGSHLSTPLAVGVKYRWNDYFDWRLEFGDDIAYAWDPHNALHDLSLTLGLELRFGGTRKAYWPWNPGLFYW
jgi:hypothetical protein